MKIDWISSTVPGNPNVTSVHGTVHFTTSYDINHDTLASMSQSQVEKHLEFMKLNAMVALAKCLEVNAAELRAEIGDA